MEAAVKNAEVGIVVSGNHNNLVIRAHFRRKPNKQSVFSYRGRANKTTYLS
jgi:hypothetical protein